MDGSWPRPPAPHGPWPTEGRDGGSGGGVSARSGGVGVGSGGGGGSECRLALQVVYYRSAELMTHLLVCCSNAQRRALPVRRASSCAVGTLLFLSRVCFLSAPLFRLCIVFVPKFSYLTRFARFSSPPPWGRRENGPSLRAGPPRRIRLRLLPISLLHFGPCLRMCPFLRRRGPPHRGLQRSPPVPQKKRERGQSLPHHSRYRQTGSGRASPGA